MQYGSLGVHDNGFNTGWKAVDFLSDGNTGVGHAPNRLLAAAGGSISYKCNPSSGQNTAAIRIDNVMYTHLLNSSNLYIGKTFSQGEEMGQIGAGTVGKNCGYASQGSGWFHVHLGFPNTGSFGADGWTLSFSDQMWRRGLMSTVLAVGLLRRVAAPPNQWTLRRRPVRSQPHPKAQRSRAGAYSYPLGVR